ncbi:cupin domain-containing protein [bacterium]|nr:cupin domain-containing protein [bacterium]
MKKIALVACAGLLVLVTTLFAQERLVPSYEEGAPYVNEHPDRVPSVYPYVNTWKNSPVAIGHGGFTEQAFFTRGDPEKPQIKGAVLKYIRAYNHGFLYGNEKTQPTKHNNEQVVFYVMKGTGAVTSAEKTVPIAEGSAVFIPVNVEYSFVNTTGDPMEVIIIVEGIPKGFTPKKVMSVKSYYDPAPGFWGNYVTHDLFSSADGLAEPMSIFVVTVDNFKSGVAHYHIEGCEEIWTKVKGEENILMLGKTMLRQDVGEAFLAPTLIPHSVINQTESPMAWLYMGNRHDKQK